jgi:hypothetical protein
MCEPRNCSCPIRRRSSTDWAAASGGRTRSWPARRVIAAVALVGTAWEIMNAAFATLFSFGPTLLFEKGQSATSAASIVSACCG